MRIFLLFITFLLSVKGGFSQQDLRKLLKNNIKGGLNATAATIILDSTNLPIVALKLPFLWPPWDPIPDTPKVTVDMGIIDNGYNAINHITDSINDYLGKIGIEKRGSISQAFWYLQKSYGLETRDTLGNDLNVSILGMPSEHDWILYAPFDDHSFMRNVLVYQLGREMGYWTPRTKFCEVQFYDWAWQPDYRGLYVMMEKIKRDKNRVDISKLDTNENSGDNLTGGYIFAVDKNIWAQDSGWASPKDTNVFFSYKYPKQDDITSQQKAYIQQYVDSFETVLLTSNFSNPSTGFRKYAEPNSFIDYFIMQEFTKNIDAFRRSGYLYKDKYSKGGKLIAGPMWDYNSSLYNAQICTFEQDTGWAYQTTCWITTSYHVPFWWGRMLQDTVYSHDLKCRWMQLRNSTLDTAHIFHLIDSMNNYIREASVRHFAKFDSTDTLQPNVDSLKWWITKRLAWLDANMPGNCFNFSVNEVLSFENSLRVFPNPSSGQLNVQFDMEAGRKLKFELTNVYGQTIKVPEEQRYREGRNSFEMDLSEFPAGIYFLKASGPGVSAAKKIILQP